MIITPQCLVAGIVFLAKTVSCASSNSQAASRAFALKSTNAVPLRWIRNGAAPSDAIISLRIGLRQNRFDEILHHLDEGTLI